MKQNIMERTSDMHSALKEAVVLIEISSLFPDVWEGTSCTGIHLMLSRLMMDNLNSQKFSPEAVLYL